VVTGGGAALISQARDAGLDTFVTGEGPHHSYFDAQEWGLNVFYAGHYATETLGVRALARHVGAKYSLDWEFIDHPTGL
jgi:putative NIF3 family GTP cyclohydrolase 1 type 2